MGFITQILMDANSIKTEDLEKLHTGTLLRKLQEVRVSMGEVHIWNEDDYHEIQKLNILKEYKDKIKKVLSTREHVPNKADRKKIRQEKAKRK